MAIAVTITDQNDNGSRLEVIGTLVFSGTYASPGDALSFASATMAKFALGQAGLMCREAPILLQITARANGYAFLYVAGATRDVGVVRIFQAFGTELGNGAYPAGITGDTMDFVATFRKFV